MSKSAGRIQLWTAPSVHGTTLPHAEGINGRILGAFAALSPEDFSHRTHFLGGRFENLYLDRDRIPELRIVLAHAESCAKRIVGWGLRPMRCGFWLNAQGPGQATSEHTHEEINELLSGVYYISVPEHSGDIVFRDQRLTIRATPREGTFLFFPPSLSHRVETNRSERTRLSLAFNFGPAETPDTS
jgi:hypothetical protein